MNPSGKSLSPCGCPGSSPQAPASIVEANAAGRLLACRGLRGSLVPKKNQAPGACVSKKEEAQLAFE